MSSIELFRPGTSLEEPVGTLDFGVAARQMEAIDAAMQQYFEASDWLEARDKALPGLSRRHWPEPEDHE